MQAFTRVRVPTRIRYPRNTGTHKSSGTHKNQVPAGAQVPRKSSGTHKNQVPAGAQVPARVQAPTRFRQCEQSRRSRLTDSRALRPVDHEGHARARHKPSNHLHSLIHRSGHTPSIAFRHLPPNSARFSYATEGALFISAHLSIDAVSALRTVRVLI